MTKFYGCYTALITPFRDGKVDEQAFQALVEHQISEGVHGLVPCGTTGESPTLGHDEHERVIELAVEAAAGRVPVMAGAGSNNTEEAIRFTQHAKRAGADAVLSVMPYYNKPGAAGQKAHFTAIADSADIPLFIYNIPGRSVVDMRDETLAELAKHPNICGIKDATGDLARVSTLRQLVDTDFVLFSGEDVTAVGFNAQGGHGVISVTANIAPCAVSEVQNLTRAGDYKAALELQDRLVPLHDVMFCEANPGPVKFAASLMGLCSADIRLPLLAPEAGNQTRIRQAVEAFGLL
ncbi:MAG: 4-hydroxy-tetrahydrodipicolinate synthase [Rickettsiales bacterium]|nr:4-hydroxy-tetrahydrodipicolinate synthase [Rickettsiales bacterium]